MKINEFKEVCVLEPKSLDDILLQEQDEEMFLECLEAMKDTPEDYLFKVPDFNDLEKEVRIND